MRNLNQSLHVILWSYVFIFIVICSLQIYQIDLWWQLSEGTKILHSWTLPTAPVAAYGLSATPYFDEYAGYEVVLAIIFKIGGFGGIWIAFIAVYLATIFLPFVTSPQKYPAFDYSTTLALFMSGILLKARLEQRPEVVGGLFLVLLMVVLRKAQLERMTWGTLAGVFFVLLGWTNTHSSFVIGLFVLGLWFACEMILKFRKFPIELLLRGAFSMGAVALIAVSLNPYGPRRLLFPFMQALDPGSTTLSEEMWPITYMSPGADQIVAIAVVLLIWGLITTKGVPLWVTLFSIFTFFLACKNFRFINLFVIALIFVYAARVTPIEIKEESRASFSRSLFKDTVLSVLCFSMLLIDSYNFYFTYKVMRKENQYAVHTRFFAPEICAIKVSDSNKRVPVLCGHGLGAYLSLDGVSQFRPFLDSGLSHFSDAAKRYFFFLWNDPEMLILALQQLHVNYVVINDNTFPWISTMHSLPDWEMVACDERGMLWKRSPGTKHPLSEENRKRVQKIVRMLLKDNNAIGAFSYSTLLDNPTESFAILSQYRGSDWLEEFYNATCNWVNSLPPATVQQLLASEPPAAVQKLLASQPRPSVQQLLANQPPVPMEQILAQEPLMPVPLVNALLSARLGPTVYEKFVATKPSGPRPWLWTALEAQNCLLVGDKKQALALFNTISPPIASVTYYRVRDQVMKANLDTTNSGLSAYGQWQTWDEDARRFFDSTSVRLNDRIAELDKQPAQ